MKISLLSVIKPMTMKVAEKNLLSISEKYCEEEARLKDLPIVCFKSMMSTPPNDVSFKLARFKPMKFFERYSLDSIKVMSDLSHTIMPIMVDELLNSEDRSDSCILIYPFLSDEKVRINTTAVFKDLEIITNSLELQYSKHNESLYSVKYNNNLSEHITTFRGFDVNMMPYLGNTKPEIYH